MFRRNLLIAAVILGLAALVIQFYSQTNEQKTDELIGASLLDEELIGKFDSLIIEDSQNRVQLLKKDDRWLVAEKENFPADMNKLVQLLDNITSHRIASLVSRDPDRLGYFKLLRKGEKNSASSSEIGVGLTLKKADRVIYKMLLGKNRPGVSAEAKKYNAPGGSYARLGDKPSVYLIKENIRLSSDPNGWIDKTLFSLEEKEIKSLKYETPSEKLVFEKKKQKFTLAGLKEKEKIKDYEVSKIFSSLKKFSFEQLRAYSLQFEKQLSLKTDVSVILADDSTMNFQLFSQTETTTPFKDKKKKEKKITHFIKIVPPSSPDLYQKRKSFYDLSSKWFFRISEWDAKKWMKTKKDFLKS